MHHATPASPSILRPLSLALAVFFTAKTLPAQLTESNPHPAATIHIRVTRPATPQLIPATLFGSFLEPIGHSTYGGLWADVIDNPSFEDGLWSPRNVEAMLRARPELRRASDLGLPLPWEPLDQSQGNRYAPIRGDAANSAQSLLVMSLPGKEVGILQQVFLPVQRELTYNGSLFLKHIQGPATVSISLRRHAHPDQILAATTVEAADLAWTKHPFTLTLRPNELRPLEPADLVLSLSNDARAQIDNVSLNPADAVDGMDPDVLALARDLQSPIIRFGGNFTSAYDWHDGVGPRDQRPSKINLSWGIPEYNTFGTDEFLRFCQLIHADPQIALNLGTGTPAQAAEWVEYVNTHNPGRKSGNLWELGNELWGDFQVGYPSPQRIAAITLATSQAVRHADPTARLIATGGDEDFFHDWNAQQLANPAGTENFLSTHFVVNDNVQLPHATNDFRAMAALALPCGLAPRMHAIQQQAAAAGQPNLKVAFTEWLMISDSHTGPHFSNLGGALFAAGFLNMAIRNSDVVQISDMTGILDFAGISKKRAQVFAAPAYWVLREYANAHPHTLLAVATDTPTYTIAHGINRLPEIADVPYLDLAAAESTPDASGHTHLLLLCLNRHLSRAQTAEIDLTAFKIKPGAPARITTIAGENLLTENDEEDPTRVHPITRTEPATPALHHTFPNASITIIDLPL